MKFALGIIVLALAQTACGVSPIEKLLEAPWFVWPVKAQTNVDGIVLGLEFHTNRIVAGERLYGRMTVSNASSVGVYITWGRGIRDAEIGDFVVTDETGNVMRRTYWPPSQHGSLGGSVLSPGGGLEYRGDVVQRYSLTNPGIYQVKGIAEVPTTNAPKHERIEKMVIETPAVEITVIPRPEGSPPPEPLYNAPQLAWIAKLANPGDAPDRQIPPPLQVTHPKPEPNPSAPQTPRSRIVPPLPDATDATSKNALSATVDQPPAAAWTRNVLCALIILVLAGGLGLFLWRSRHRQSEGPTSR